MRVSERAAQIGAVIRSRRLKLGLTQIELAELAGTKQGTVSEIENGHPTVRLDTLHALATALGLDVGLVPRDAPGLQEEETR